MPTFPTYHGELPQYLSPLKLRHYLMLAYWVYFRPTALNCYLHQADPKAYRTSESVIRNIGMLWRSRAWRSLWFMAPGEVVLVSAAIGIPLMLMASSVQSIPPNWPGIAIGVGIGVAVGFTLFAVFGMVVGLSIGLTVGITAGVTIGAIIAMVYGVIGNIAESISGNMAASAAQSLAGSLAGGVESSLARSLAENAERNVVVSAAIRLTSAAMLGLALGIAIRVTFYAAGSMAFGMMIGVIAGIVAGIGFAVAMGLGIGVVFGTAAIMGALQAVVYPPALAQAFLTRTNPRRLHPVEWDELAILPLPWSEVTIIHRLSGDWSRGLNSAITVARNPFQRWALQRGLHTFIHTTPRPLHSLYAILSDPATDEYIAAPTSERQWRELPSVKQVLLGEIGGLWVDGTGGDSRTSERMAWVFTRRLRNHELTPLTRFTSVLHMLADETAIEANQFDLDQYQEIISNIQDYPGGSEIASSFAALSACLSCTSLPHLRKAQQSIDQVVHDVEPIRPAVLAALSRLSGVAAEIATFQASTSRVNQLAAIGRSSAAMEDLGKFVNKKVPPPEQVILHRIIRQWRPLISEAGGEVGRAAIIAPVVNPYVLNNPVKPPLFQGREDVLRRLEELWSGEGQKPSVVLYGHRRMGKSSILQNLGDGVRFGRDTIIVDFNMQRVGHVHSTGELLHSLALALYDVLPMQARQALNEPGDQQFLSHNPYTAFDSFLRQVKRVINGQRFIITLDEFELIENAIEEQALEPRLLDYWRGLIQTYPWFIMTFAGLHTLQEMTQYYWHPLFGSVTAVPVSFLNPGAARRVITNPAPDFVIDFDQDAIDLIISLTNGQPYLVQLIGHGLVTRFNRQSFEEGIERERRFSLPDVEAVIDAPELFRDGVAYFQGVWVQARDDPVLGQPKILSALANSDGSLTAQEIVNATGNQLNDVVHGLEALQQHDVVVEREDRWRMTVELMRRWVAHNHPLA